MRPQTNASGFTLSEVMVVLAITIIIAGFAVPAMSNFINNASQNTTLNTLRTALQLGSTEAIRLGKSNVILLTRISKNDPLAPDNLHCQDSQEEDENWSCGWRLINDANKNKKWDKDEHVYHSYIISSNQISVTHKAKPSALAFVLFAANGTTSSLGHSFSTSISDSSGNSVEGNTLCITAGGRMRYVKNSRC